MLKPVRRTKLHSDCSDSDKVSGPSPAKAILPKPRAPVKQKTNLPRPIQQNIVVDQSLGAETVRLIKMINQPEPLQFQEENVSNLTPSQRTESFKAKYLYFDSQKLFINKNKLKQWQKQLSIQNLNAAVFDWPEFLLNIDHKASTEFKYYNLQQIDQELFASVKTMVLTFLDQDLVQNLYFFLFQKLDLKKSDEVELEVFDLVDRTYAAYAVEVLLQLFE